MDVADRLRELAPDAPTRSFGSPTPGNVVFEGRWLLERIGCDVEQLAKAARALGGEARYLETPPSKGLRAGRRIEAPRPAPVLVVELPQSIARP